MTHLNIACFVPRHYDYLAATLIQGLIHLGHNCLGSENANYVHKISPRRMRDFLNQCDIVIVFSGSKNLGVLENIQTKAHRVYVDGSDFPYVKAPKIIFDYLFKREILRCVNTEAYPLQFGVKDHYIQKQTLNCKWLVSFVGAMTNYTRLSVQEYLRSQNAPDIFAGSTNERAYDGKSGYPLKTPDYSSIINNSLGSIDIPGLGWDCGRTWEVLGSGALLIQARSELLYCEELIENEHFIAFSNLKELAEIINEMRQKPQKYMEIRKVGYQNALRKHSSKARAEYFLNILKVGKPNSFLGTEQVSIGQTHNIIRKVKKLLSRNI